MCPYPQEQPPYGQQPCPPPGAQQPTFTGPQPGQGPQRSWPARRHKVLTGLIAAAGFIIVLSAIAAAGASGTTKTVTEPGPTVTMTQPGTQVTVTVTVTATATVQATANAQGRPRRSAPTACTWKAPNATGSWTSATSPNRPGRRWPALKTDQSPR